MQVNISTPDHLLKIDQVSCGTMNQVYLALRLASAQLLTGDADLPILLDEPFAMYDEERLESALRFLISSGRQVILFSCQKRELEILAKIQGRFFLTFYPLLCMIATLPKQLIPERHQCLLRDMKHSGGYL